MSVLDIPGALCLLAIAGFGLPACSGGARDAQSAPAPVDSSEQGSAQSKPAPVAPPTPAAQDTPPSGGAQHGEVGGPKVSQAEYEGWRQYSVNCARCHGQDVLPNPVAANLLISLAPGGPIDNEQTFSQVVNDGRPERGMPAFKGVLSQDQIGAMYAYVQGRAAKRIPPGRPARPGA
jgi:mono/diheme cytochrome c family protein